MRRIALFGASIAALLVLTYAGVLLAFSVPLTDEMQAANPSVPSGARAVVAPVGDRGALPTLSTSATPALIMYGEGKGSFPTGAANARMGRAIVYVPAGSNETVVVANMTLDLAALSAGQEGWVAMGEADSAPWFSPEDRTLGEVVRFETPLKLGLLFGVGAIGFVAPLVVVILTHRPRGPQAPRGDGAAAPGTTSGCRECRAPLAANAEFCMRCGAYTKGGPKDG